MIDGNANDFIDKLSYEDHYVIFDNKKYFFNDCQTGKDTSGAIKSVRLEIYDLTNEKRCFLLPKNLSVIV